MITISEAKAARAQCHDELDAMLYDAAMHLDETPSLQEAVVLAREVVRDAEDILGAIMRTDLVLCFCNDEHGCACGTDMVQSVLRKLREARERWTSEEELI